MKKKIGIYHNRDLDGICSAAIMKKRYPEIELIGYDYGQEFDFEKIKDAEVIMADVSLPMNDMIKVSRNAADFIWIDHHISAIKEFERINPDYIDAYLDSKFAACENTWFKLFPDSHIPDVVTVLGKYDTWRQDDEWDRILSFQYGMRSICTCPEEFPMELLIPTNGDNWSMLGIRFSEILFNGEAILSYLTQNNKLVCNIASYEKDLFGLRAVCVNSQLSNTQLFESVWDPDKHDIMVCFRYLVQGWSVSLYTTHDHIDCSKIAKTMGGGGHKKAAGFPATDISSLLK